MLDSVVLQTASPYTLNITAVDPDEILIVKSISGLSPADFTLFTGEFARDGGYYQGRRVDKRNPVLTLKMNPDYKQDFEVSDIREELYRMFLTPSPGSDTLQVNLYDDRKPARYFKGVTEKIETDMWAKEQTAMVSMIAVDPYLRSVNAVNASDAAGWVTTTINYDGSAPTGINATFKVKTASNWLVFFIGNDSFVLNRPFAINDSVVIDTNAGSRSVKVNGVDAMAAMTASSKWVQLRNGPNAIMVYGDSYLDGKISLMNYNYRSAWWGI